VIWGLQSLSESAYSTSIFDVNSHVTVTMTSYSGRHSIQSRHIWTLGPG